MMQKLTNPFPLATSSLIHCITNEISCEMLANGILALGCKPVMADDPREVLDFTMQSQALFINLGHLSAEKEKAIRMAATYANQACLPMVVDAVGVAASPIRKDLVRDLFEYKPTVLKGNMSEIRSLVGLKHHGVGVDASHKDQETEDLLQALKDWCQLYPGMSFLVTGPKDLIVSENQVAILGNGCAELDWITGTGDLVGALTAVFLSQGKPPFEASCLALSYLNIAAERIVVQGMGLEDFRYQVLNQLSLLKRDENWLDAIKGDFYE
ncbi:putative hydroxyethylthiazole kinase [Streptococcus oralis SK304]|uniref:Hydroxyethylthiazole kinase n=2 Tax=Streptococcus oralis TaxID=1303 RepID=J4K9I1_STROR|nr:putative hydroxyethylthiazole kinase [Streptococcus oralis SK304]